jgi:Asp-tRNA(Asn)/Glu-tRNA(Gln) amidotransferase A subunit family amidase
MQGHEDDQEGQAMSDTPRTDAAEHHQHDTNPPQPLGLVDAEVCRELERELNNANDRIAALEAHVARLEEAGNAIDPRGDVECDCPPFSAMLCDPCYHASKAWAAAKEAKP